jgi:hypothetical protein
MVSPRKYLKYKSSEQFCMLDARAPTIDRECAETSARSEARARRDRPPAGGGRARARGHGRDVREERRAARVSPVRPRRSARASASRATSEFAESDFQRNARGGRRLVWLSLPFSLSDRLSRAATRVAVGGMCQRVRSRAMRRGGGVRRRVGPGPRLRRPAAALV